MKLRFKCFSTEHVRILFENSGMPNEPYMYREREDDIHTKAALRLLMQAISEILSFATLAA